MADHSRQPVGLSGPDDGPRFGQTPSRPPRGRVGWYLVLLVIGVVLVWFLLEPPGRNSALRQQARRVICASNLHQIGVALSVYAVRNGGVLPADPVAVVAGEMKWEAEKVLRCPAAVAKGNSGEYIYIPGYNWSVSRRPIEDVLVYEPLGNHPGGRANVLFADGHVECLPPEMYQAAIDRTVAKVAKAASQPASRPAGR